MKALSKKLKLTEIAMKSFSIKLPGHKLLKLCYFILANNLALI